MNREIETTLIEKASQGDTAAFEEIYFSLRDSIYGFAYRMLRETAATEDITQEVFMFLFENPKKYEPERGSLRSFLYGVARNKIMRHLQKRGMKPEIVWEDAGEFNKPQDKLARNPLDSLLDEELIVKVEESLAKLPPLQREVIILREMQELSCEEIAREVFGQNIYFSVPNKGRFIISPFPRKGFDFQKIGVIIDNNLSFLLRVTNTN